MYVLDFLTELLNTEVSVTILKGLLYTTDALTAVSKMLGTYKGNTCGGVNFRYSYRWVDWTAQSF